MTTHESEFEQVIQPGRRQSHYWRELWRYRELFYFLSWRDILVRYKQTAVGLAWSIIRPLLTMVVFTLIFGRLAGLPSHGVPYALLVLAAMIPWQFFATALNEASMSLIGNSNLLTKVYFPRLIIPASAVITSLIDCLISFLILAAMMAYYRFVPPVQILFVPLLLLLAFVASFGAGLLFCALNVKYRDFRYIVPFLIQLGLYVSPVGFSSAIIPERWRLLYSLNPMAGVIDGFRWAILGEATPLYIPGFVLSSLLSLVLLWYAVRVFRRMERTFADVV